MQKHVNLVDLVKSFPTSIYLQNLASIQPRTSRSKFGLQITLLITYRASCSLFGSGKGRWRRDWAGWEDDGKFPSRHVRYIVLCSEQFDARFDSMPR